MQLHTLLVVCPAVIQCSGHGEAFKYSFAVRIFTVQIKRYVGDCHGFFSKTLQRVEYPVMCKSFQYIYRNTAGRMYDHGRGRNMNLLK